MTRTRQLYAFGLALASMIFSLGSSVGVQAQGDPATLVQEKLVGEVKITKAASDHSDIVTAGDVMLLHKDGLMMCSSSSSYAYSNTYFNGVLGANIKNRAKDALRGWGKGILTGGGSDITGSANNGCPSRKFVAGEKFWVTSIASQKDGILVSTFSDPYKDASGNDVRYYGEIKFPFAKGSVPQPDSFVKTFEEVMTVVPSDDSKDKGSDQAAAKEAPAAPAAPAAPSAPMAAIPPPPPPADAPPPTVEIGETKDKVIAGFGQPTLIKKPTALKEIYVYKDMKVTFTKGRVTSIE